jgi:nitrate/nitrite transport system ATP-binding protein
VTALHAVSGTRTAGAAGEVQIDAVSKAYGAAVIVDRVSLTIADGEFVTLIGHSGCGKSTVLSMVAGLLPPSAGQIRVGGAPIAGAGPDRGMVFQAPCLLPWLSVAGNVQLGVDQVFPAEPVAARRRRAEDALARVGLGDAVDRRPSALSAGMRQRAQLARAFALEPRTLLLDEPFGMLDSVTRAELQDALLAMDAARPTTLMVTHDIDEAILLSDRIAVMTDGPAARIREVLTVPFARPRDRGRLMAHPDCERLRDRLLALLGTEAELPERSEAA